MATRLRLVRCMSIVLLCYTVWVRLATAEDIKRVDWRTLVQLDYKTGAYPKQLGELNGAMVKVPGYAVPLHMEGQKIVEFTLVPQFGMCIHIPPPPPNQMVYVKLKEGVPYQEVFARPVWITGELNIVKTDSVYGSTAFTIADAHVRPYEMPKR